MKNIIKDIAKVTKDLQVLNRGTLLLLFSTRLYICMVFFNDFLGVYVSYFLSVSFESSKYYMLTKIKGMWPGLEEWEKWVSVFFMLVLSIFSVVQVSGFLSYQYSQTMSVSDDSKNDIKDLKKELATTDSKIINNIKERDLLDPIQWRGERKKLLFKIEKLQSDSVRIDKEISTLSAEKVKAGGPSESIAKTFGGTSDNFASIVIVLFDILLEIMFAFIVLTKAKKPVKEDSPKKEGLAPTKIIYNLKGVKRGLLKDRSKELFDIMILKGWSCKDIAKFTGAKQVETVRSWLREREIPVKALSMLKKIIEKKVG